MPLRLVIESASHEELARGVAAAEAVFQSSGISYEDAASGMLAVELWDMKGFPEDAEPTEEQDAAASVWFEAERAACEACCAGWSEDKVVRAHRVLGIGPVEPKVKTVNLATWPDRQRRYREIVQRLETATGPDRQLDIDVCYVMGWINEPGTPEEAVELGLPYLTGSLPDAAEITEKSLPGWKIEIDQEPCDARIIQPERDEDDDMSVAAWRCPDGYMHMEKPPANTAIALTLAAMRLQADSFLPQAW
ncbi:hypothetical protein FJ938_14480 [Mesorhizobium sp. B2-4-14]|uniref:hypothetical protein n=1 Tax=Mesorhizobium sp. B2-4-14 TaxID=2589935 RepID=UPI001125CF5B|nr:hypothetical protein [Mesorhizobium sp. B2-4-14]TPL05817.1 hypothetical protein FJ938_14480 [Mesorhizobium sp. B2-4-14]